MKIIKTKKEVQFLIKEFQLKNKTTAFVPTMGALHLGHLKLVRKAKEENDIVIVSIFVNPKQFNEKRDFTSYPNTIKADIKKLEQENCNILFAPTTDEIYDKKSENCKSFEFDFLNSIMEGKFRPQHFEGVVAVIKKLFNVIKTDTAYFGKKDYQQLMIIKKIVNDCKYKVKIKEVDIVREKSGLAMSSRNARLSAKEKENAANIYKLLSKAKRLLKNNSIDKVKQLIISEFNKIQEFRLEYFEIRDKYTLNESKNNKNAIAFVAVYLSEVRLIDNIEFL